jgi:hypothetical protein
MRDKERELRDKIQSHLGMATADRIERGDAPAEAAAAARRQLGNISHIQDSRAATSTSAIRGSRCRWRL